jgi:hypothetical protein
VLVVLYTALLIIYLLSQPLSSHAKRAVVLAAPFDLSTQVVANVFCMASVDMIVSSQVTNREFLLA